MLLARQRQMLQQAQQQLRRKQRPERDVEDVDLSNVFGYAEDQTEAIQVDASGDANNNFNTNSNGTKSESGVTVPRQRATPSGEKTIAEAKAVIKKRLNIPSADVVMVEKEKEPPKPTPADKLNIDIGNQTAADYVEKYDQEYVIKLLQLKDWHRTNIKKLFQKVKEYENEYGITEQLMSIIDRLIKEILGKENFDIIWRHYSMAKLRQTQIGLWDRARKNKSNHPPSAIDSMQVDLSSDTTNHNFETPPVFEHTIDPPPVPNEQDAAPAMKNDETKSKLTAGTSKKAKKTQSELKSKSQDQVVKKRKTKAESKSETNNKEKSVAKAPITGAESDAVEKDEDCNNGNVESPPTHEELTPPISVADDVSLQFCDTNALRDLIKRVMTETCDNLPGYEGEHVRIFADKEFVEIVDFAAEQFIRRLIKRMVRLSTHRRGVRVHMTQKKIKINDPLRQVAMIEKEDRRAIMKFESEEKGSDGNIKLDKKDDTLFGGDTNTMAIFENIVASKSRDQTSSGQHAAENISSMTTDIADHMHGEDDGNLKNATVGLLSHNRIQIHDAISALEDDPNVLAFPVSMEKIKLRCDLVKNST